MMAAGALAGRRVAVTRPAGEDDELAALLARAGAVPLLFPIVAIAPPADPRPLLAAAEAIASYDWVVFTSANAVRAVAHALRESRPSPARVAAVGPATALAVHELLGWNVDAVPARHLGSEVARSMQAVERLEGRRVLWPRAQTARDELPRDLRAAGARLDDPVAYRTVGLVDSAQRLAAAIGRGAVDAVVVTSPSAVECLAGVQPRMQGIVLCAIGPTTGDAARRHGLEVQVQPARHTIAGLVDALREYFEHRQDRSGPAGAGGER